MGAAADCAGPPARSATVARKKPACAGSGAGSSGAWCGVLQYCALAAAALVQRQQAAIFHQWLGIGSSPVANLRWAGGAALQVGCCWTSTAPPTRRPDSQAGPAAMAEAATALFLADTTAASAAMPWKSFTPTAELDPEKEYYCVATWGVMSLAAAPAFWRKTSQISVAELPPGQCVGESRAVRMAWPCSFVAETLTVWHDRNHSLEFFRTDAHRQGMHALQGRVEFRAHRVWVKAADLPRPGEAAGTLWSRVKQGEFRKVGALEEEESDDSDGGGGDGGVAVCPFSGAGGVNDAGRCPGSSTGTQP